MHRTLDVTVAPEATEEIASILVKLDDVIGLSVSKGASRKPPGDMLTIEVLNRGADDVLREIARMERYGPVNIVTSETASIIDTREEAKIEGDVDEAIWEEMRAGLRQQGRVTQNFVILMALGGILSVIGLVSDPAPQAVAFVAAACISPGFEPFTGIAVGLFFRKGRLVVRSAGSVLVGYGVVVTAAALAFWLMQILGSASAQQLVENAAVKAIVAPTAKEILVSICGAASGVVILSAYRRSVIVGALIALVTIPAAALIGASLVVGKPALALEGLRRVGLDAALIVAIGVLVFWYKQVVVHKRKPMM